MTCEHNNTRLTRRVVRNGAVQYVHQCQKCGESMNQPVAHAKVMALTGGVMPPDFDPGIRDRWNAERLAEQRAAEEAESNAPSDPLYQQYLASALWRAKRRAVIERCGNLCEGCRAASVEDVHHLTYKHVYNEFLFELVGLCRDCHERIHGISGGQEN